MHKYFVIPFILLVSSYNFGQSSQIERYEIHVHSANKKKVTLKNILKEDLKVDQTTGLLVDSLNVFNIYIGKNQNNTKSISKEDLDKLKMISKCNSCFIEYLVFDSNGKGILAQEYDNGTLVFEKKYKKKHDWEQ